MSKSSKKIRQYARVKLKPEWVEIYETFYPPKSLPLTFLGEIPNMPGHGVFIGLDGKIYNGMHIESFEEMTEEDF